jgi:hypothetical protein
MVQPPSDTVNGKRIALLACAALLGAFAAISWNAAVTKSATYDEPYHLMGAWVAAHHLDFRIDNPDPPLWMYWAAIPNGRDAMRADFNGQLWQSIPANMPRQWYWCVQTLYRTNGNDADAVLRRSRAMMLTLGVALGALIAWWAWQLAGPIAAVVAVGLFSFDPNFLAHAPLVKNDVVFALAMLLLAVALWQVGRRLTWPRVMLLVLATVVIFTVKFSGVLAGVLVPVVLGVRALMPREWRVFGRTIGRRRNRLLVAAGASGVCAVAAVVGIWAVYGFRFNPTPDPDVHFDTDELVRMAATNEAILRGDRIDPAAAPLVPGHFVRTLRWAESRRLLPQAYLAGMLFTYQSALLRPAFLHGGFSARGWWYYFPLAMLVKTPMATIVAVIGALFMLGLSHGRAVGVGKEVQLKPTALPWDWDRVWSLTCLLIPAAIYMSTAMRGNLNLGLRHVLAVYPPLYIATGCAAAYLVRRWSTKTIVVLTILSVGLVIESLTAYPDFIPFFNAAAGGRDGGIRLLGDSNLDWGQDLPALAVWQREHPDAPPMYLAYFGLADPLYYGIRYAPLPGGYHYDPSPQWPHGDCVIAVSATYLQGLHVDSELFDKFYRPLAKMRPIEILGGSIYLYRLDAR